MQQWTEVLHQYVTSAKCLETKKQRCSCGVSFDIAKLHKISDIFICKKRFPHYKWTIFSSNHIMAFVFKSNSVFQWKFKGWNSVPN